MLEWVLELVGSGIGIIIVLLIIFFIIAMVFGIIKLILELLLRYGWILIVLFLIGWFYNDGEKPNFFNNIGSKINFLQSDDYSVGDVDLTEQQDVVQQFMQNYSAAMVDAINNNDYSIVKSFIKADSPLEQAQRKLIGHLDASNVTEEVNYIEVQDIIKLDANTYRVLSFESIYVTNSTSTKLSEYIWAYELEVINQQPYLKSIQEFNQ